MSDRAFTFWTTVGALALGWVLGFATDLWKERRSEARRMKDDRQAAIREAWKAIHSVVGAIEAAEFTEMHSKGDVGSYLDHSQRALDEMATAKLSAILLPEPLKSAAWGVIAAFDKRFAARRDPQKRELAWQTTADAVDEFQRAIESHAQESGW